LIDTVILALFLIFASFYFIFIQLFYEIFSSLSIDPACEFNMQENLKNPKTTPERT